MNSNDIPQLLLKLTLLIFIIIADRGFSVNPCSARTGTRPAPGPHCLYNNCKITIRLGYANVLTLLTY